MNSTRQGNFEDNFILKFYYFTGSTQNKIFNFHIPLGSFDENNLTLAKNDAFVLIYFLCDSR